MLTEKRKAYLRAWYEKNQERIREKHRQWRMANPEKMRAARIRGKTTRKRYEKELAINNPEKVKELKRAEYLRNRAKYIARAKAWKQKNLDRARELQALGRIRNREKRRAQARIAWQKKKNNARGSLDHKMGRLVWMTLRGVGGKRGTSWKKLLGYGTDELRKHLESRFTDGMTWEKYMAGEIHTDHIIPVSWFKYESANDPVFKKCWALENLQPMWARDNLIKQARWSGGAIPCAAHR